MSSSSQERRPGRVFMSGAALGPGFAFEDQARGGRKGLSVQEEEDYMAAVTARAQAKAKEILLAAQAELAALRQQALEQGYQEGLARAQDELAQAHAAMADSLAQALASVREGCRVIYAEHRQDLILLLRASLEKILGHELEQRRAEILAVFLDEALERLDGLKQLTVVVHPADEEVVSTILEMARPRYHDLEHWRVRVDQSIPQGSLFVESGQGMVHNSLPARLDAVHRVLEHLDLPPASVEKA